MPDRRSGATLVAGLICLPLPALAHSPVPGIEGFYAGIAHTMIEPALLMASLSVAIMIVQDWPHRLRAGWPVYALAVLAGLLSGRWMADYLTVNLWLLATACLCALLTAVGSDRLTPFAVGLLGVGGFLIGIASLPDPGPLSDVVITTFGAIVGANFALIVVAGGVDWLRARRDGPVINIGQRIVASWIAAASLLMLAFLLKT